MSPNVFSVFVVVVFKAGWASRSVVVFSVLFCLFCFPFSFPDNYRSLNGVFLLGAFCRRPNTFVIMIQAHGICTVKSVFESSSTINSIPVALRRLYACSCNK